MMLAFLNNLIDLLTGSVWTYPILFGICVGDAVFPAFPSETAMIVCGIQAARGNLSLPAVIAVGAAGAVVGDNTTYAPGRRGGPPAGARFFRGARAPPRPPPAQGLLSDPGGRLPVPGRALP